MVHVTQKPKLSPFTAPSLEPVTLAEAKRFARISSATEDQDINDFIAGARKLVEIEANRSLITQVWDCFFDKFPYTGCAIKLPRPPVISVASVKYTPNGAGQLTMSASDYFVDNTLDRDSRPREAEISTVIGKAWPGDQLQVANGVVVRFTSGFGPAATDVPEYLRATIKQIVAFWYRNRETAGCMSQAVKDIIAGGVGGFAVV